MEEITLEEWVVISKIPVSLTIFEALEEEGGKICIKPRWKAWVGDDVNVYPIINNLDNLQLINWGQCESSIVIAATPNEARNALVVLMRGKILVRPKHEPTIKDTTQVPDSLV